ncbi:hypothetical protein [Clostridium formicaceticum]|uniref:MOSC domain-containing protein n=1 Tax=Clostridium formicaceticum TaxID=1497 RepID=A0AAC9RP71_9CLOT|nr:hypothetical protein [Clostridium formicaceticum]AOY74786.1 hypothetical protein BJL90_01730 [Clostridium formicaceticum]ARE89177.1 hypothetical protein CLFO_35830 [Clostridium formicaceticum]
MAKVKAIFYKNGEGVWKQYEKIQLEIPREERAKENISFITTIGYDKLQSDKIRGFCHQRFKGNFIIEGLNMPELLLDKKISIGSAMIEITAIGKKCHTGCPALDEGDLCTLSRHIFFGKVLKAGIIHHHDTIKF